MTRQFQLHHTGIKTFRAVQGFKYVGDFNCTIQELKRDGIKRIKEPDYNFNCTIQELKRDDGKATAKAFAYFNCTIQELKPDSDAASMAEPWRFQLHHTGIKTTQTKNIPKR